MNTAYRFPLGQLVATRGVASLMEHDAAFREAVSDCISRHHAGDWGDMDAEDCATNEDALLHGSRLMSDYSADGTRIWIITEADRSVTTVLFPEEY